MCLPWLKGAHARNAEKYRIAFNVEPPQEQGKLDTWPGYCGVFIRRPKEAGNGDDAVPEREALAGVFGLLPHWAKDEKLARNTYNARSETVTEKPSFRDAWRWGKHCIIPADAIYKPDHRGSKPISTRIARADGEPMGIAGPVVSLEISGWRLAQLHDVDGALLNKVNDFVTKTGAARLALPGVCKAFSANSAICGDQ